MIVEQTLTLHSSCGRASHPLDVAAPSEHACHRTHTCCLECLSDWSGHVTPWSDGRWRWREQEEKAVVVEGVRKTFYFKRVTDILES